MKKVAFKVTQSNISKFLDTVVGLSVKPIVSISTDAFFETITIVWFVLNDEQLDGFKNNGFTPEKKID